ncbi:hypothetical protein KSS87_012710 [Heliosperma pusillum]|nr:hypothetical protein KSS87_012710 [Heliosperma pusillum]
MGDVSLGLPGSWAANNREASDHYTTKVGGLPDWPFPTSLAAELLQCNSCRSTPCLIAQVHAPISTATVKIEERVIYIFGCTDVHCGSWRAIRVQKPDKFEEINSGDSERSQSTISDPSTSVSKWWESEENGEKEGMDMEDLARALSEAATLASGSGKRKTKKKAKRQTEISAQPHQSAANPNIVDGSTLAFSAFFIYELLGHNNWSGMQGRGREGERSLGVFNPNISNARWI